MCGDSLVQEQVGLLTQPSYASSERRNTWLHLFTELLLILALGALPEHSSGPFPPRILEQALWGGKKSREGFFLTLRIKHVPQTCE